MFNVLVHQFFLGLALSFLANAAQPLLSMTVPPLQWINLSNLTSGSRPPPLRDSAMGYDINTGNLMIFGGESDLSGFVTQTTYLLNLDTLNWTKSTPVLDIDALNQVPPARSKALGGADYAANQRLSFLMYGGMDSNGNPLSDIWSYSYADRFWHQTIPSAGPSPSARWSAIGGTDETLSIRVPNPSNFENTLYVFGGSSSTSIDPLSDSWELTIDGALSANNLDTTAVWSPVHWSHALPGYRGAGSAVLPNEVIVSYGGCGTAAANGGVFNASCAQQESFILNVKAKTNSSSSNCPTPRFAPNVVPNYNTNEFAFGTQVFVIFGSFDPVQWNDSAPLQKGEVAVLDSASSTWSRILPAGDPDAGTSKSPAFPSAREGAAALSYPSGLVGDPSIRSQWSDVIFFGGLDSETGSLTDELWLLRSYAGSVTSSGQHWSGYINGNLQGGPNANGQGVTVTYLEQCAQFIELKGNGPSGTSSSSSGAPGATQSQQPAQSSSVIDTSTAHKVLSPVAVALLLGAFSVLRPVSSENQTHDSYTNFRLFYCALFLGILSIGCSVAGVVLAITKSMVMQELTKRKRGLPNPAFKSAHGVIGLVLTILLYVMLVLLALSGPIGSRFNKRKPQMNSADGKDAASVAPSRPSTAMQSYGDQLSRPSSPSTARGRKKSGGSVFGSPLPWPSMHKTKSRHSIDGDIPPTEPSETPKSKGFEVVNRPKNLRAQTHTPGHPSTSTRHHLPRSLSEINWLERRRSLNTAGELDYALSQFHNQQHSLTSHPPSNPRSLTVGSTHPLIAPPDRLVYRSSTAFLSPSSVIGRVVFRLLILANIVFTLVALRRLQSLAPFAIFLAWSTIVYLIMIILAWNGIPRSSLSALFISTIRGRPRGVSLTTYGDKSNALSTPTSPIDEASAQVATDGPYLHNPPVRRQGSASFDYPPHSHLSPRPVESDPDDDEEDDEKQLRMEREMQRRDVSIITVPRRQLRIANL